MESEVETRLSAGKVDRWISYKIRLAQILAYRAFEERMADEGRAPRYLGLLSVIEAHPGQPQSRLAEAVALRRSSLVTIIDQLQADGLVERRASETDRRVNGIWLTVEGQRTVRTLRKAAREHENRLTEGLSERDVEQLADSLDHIVANLARMMD